MIREVVYLCFIIAVLPLQIFCSIMGPLNIFIKKMSHCDSNDNKYTYKVYIKTHNHNSTYQTLDVDYIATKPLGNIRADVLIQLKDGDSYHTLYNSTTHRLCFKFDQYMGQTLVQIRNNLGMATGCPWPSGRYVAKNMRPDFSAIPLNQFPYGGFKFTAKIYNDQERRHLAACWVLDVENKNPAA